MLNTCANDTMTGKSEMLLYYCMAIHYESTLLKYHISGSSGLNVTQRGMHLRRMLLCSNLSPDGVFFSKQVQLNIQACVYNMCQSVV